MPELETVAAAAEGGLARAKGFVWDALNTQWVKEPGNDVFTATFASGASLSSVVALGASKLAGLVMPAAWTSAALSFEVLASLGASGVPLYDDFGAEATVNAGAGTSRAIGIDGIAGVLAPWPYIRIRSGLSGGAIAQAAPRTITVFGKR